MRWKPKVRQWHLHCYLSASCKYSLPLLVLDKYTDSEEDLRAEDVEAEVDLLTSRAVQQRTHRWRPVEYDSAAAWSYLLAKSAFDYATVRKIMDEIKRREPEYQPRTIFDFGSGVGAAIWCVLLTSEINSFRPAHSSRFIY